jgi:tRNA threonylcarbamoyladenosine biosynthesis protein TsaB
MLTSYILSRHDSSLQPEQGWLLAIDTSSDRAGIALLRGEALHACSWPAARAQTTQVPPRVHDLLATVGITPADLSGVAVASGPGTFTGLRVGLSLAKGFAIAGGLPIVGVPTLVATALPWARAGVPVVAVLPAGRGRLVWQHIRPEELDEATPPVNGTPDELLAALPAMGTAAVVGELPGPLAAALEPAAVPVVVTPGLGGRIEAVALLGQQRLRDGRADDLATLEPVYVHGTSRVARPVRDRPA